MSINSKPDIIISIATIPSRINCMKPTLESLMAGSLVPTKIFVNHPEYCKLEKSNYQTPEFFSDQDFCRNVIELNTTPVDWGPGTKLLGATVHLTPDSYLVIADDDVVYHPTFLSRIMNAQFNENDHAYSYFTYRVRGLTVGQGCDGLSMKSEKLDGVREFYDTHVAGTTLTYHDDIWIAYFLATKGVQIRRISNPSKQSLVYEQIIPNNVLAIQKGDLKRETIARTHIPRLFAAIKLPFFTRARFKLIAIGDYFKDSWCFVMDLWRRGARKIIKMANADKP